MIVAPSILASKEETRIAECSALYEYGAKWIHIDIMDGKFVPATTFGPEIVKQLKEGVPSLFRDVHLMVVSPEKVAPEFIKQGAEAVTFHYEAYDNDGVRFALIRALRRSGVKAGISIKPATPVEVLLPFLKEIDLILIMSVEPGKGGQSFMESALGKIYYLSRQKQIGGYHYRIEVDGGINDQTGKLCLKAGAEVLVAGSYLFGKPDQKQRVEALLK